jgi:hypothetical protein
MSTTVSSMNAIDAWKSAMSFHYDRFQAAREACRTLMANEAQQRILQDLRPSSPICSKRVQIMDDSEEEEEVASSSLSYTALDGDDSNFALISRTCNLRASDGSSIVEFVGDVPPSIIKRKDDDDGDDNAMEMMIPQLEECDVVRGLPLPIAIPIPKSKKNNPTVIANKKKKKNNEQSDSSPKNARKRRPLALASESAALFPFEVLETPAQRDARIAAIKKLVASMPRDKMQWRWTGPKKKKASSGAAKRRKSEEEQEAKKEEKKKASSVSKKGYPKDSPECMWLDSVCLCLSGFEWRVFMRIVDANNVKGEVLRSPVPGSREVLNEGIIEIPGDSKCMNCRQRINNTHQDLAVLLCDCERRKASTCLSCKLACWVRTLSDDDGDDQNSTCVQPFDANGNLKRVKCPTPRCFSYWSPEDLLILRTVTNFYVSSK